MFSPLTKYPQKLLITLVDTALLRARVFPSKLKPCFNVSFHLIDFHGLDREILRKALAILEADGRVSCICLLFNVYILGSTGDRVTK